MPNAYLTIKRKHEKEVNNFPFVWAFSDEQFVEAMAKLGLTVTDTDKIYSIGGGGYVRKTDWAAMGEMFERHRKEMKEAIDGDTTGEGFIYDMFRYELANHEYSVTWDVLPSLRALGLTIDEVNESKVLTKALKKAEKAVVKESY